jgi:hypothetical protein
LFTVSIINKTLFTLKKKKSGIYVFLGISLSELLIEVRCQWIYRDACIHVFIMDTSAAMWKATMNKQDVKIELKREA